MHWKSFRPLALLRQLDRQHQDLLHGVGAPDLWPLLSEAERQLVTATQIKIVFAVSKGIVGAIGGALILTVVAANYFKTLGEQLAIWGWFGFITACIFYILAAVVRFAERPRDVNETLVAGRNLRIVSMIYGGSWGCSAWIFLAPKDAGMLMPLVITLTLIMAASGTISIYRPLMAAYILPLVFIFTAGVFRLGGPINISICLGMWLLAYTVLEYSKIHHNAIKATIGLRLQSEKLLQQVSEQQQTTNQALRQAQLSQESAELANQGKSTFLAAASHDLRQPMHALVQYFGQLERQNRDPRLGDTVVRIGKSLESMQDLLDSILEISKLMMGAIRPEVTSFSVSTLLDRLDAQMRPLAESKGLDFWIEDCEVVLETDEVLLERIVRNLVLNAIRYTQVGRVLVRCKSCTAGLRIEVWDTGIGVLSVHRQKIFQEFFQVGNSARDSRKGLGLGLSLVRQLCDLLGLRLRLHSIPNKGSVFAVEVPVSRAPAAPALSRPAGVSRDFTRGAFVVLIDDTQSSLDATAATLRLFGCRVLAAASGLDALERLQGQEWMPNLVISDYRLRDGETGINAIRAVVENQRARFGDEFNIPALIVSGDTAPSELLKVQQAGFEMLHKPVKVEIFYAAVNKTLERLAKLGAEDRPASPNEL